MTKKTHLLIIDPQNDFCDLPDSWLPVDAIDFRGYTKLKPGLPVTGAHYDMLRLSGVIQSAKQYIDGITITLDSHHAVGIERTTFWRQGNGKPVAPFTQITLNKVRTGECLPVDPSQLDAVMNYLQALEAAGKNLIVWPVHCVQGTWGHNVHGAVMKAVTDWEVAGQRQSAKVMKGTNPMTEHYSPFKAEVPMPGDEQTELRKELIQGLLANDVLYIAGEASSHCVLAGVEDIVSVADQEQIGKIALVIDAMSPVTGFEAQASAFLEKMSSLGVRLVTCQQMVDELQVAEKAKALSPRP